MEILTKIKELFERLSGYDEIKDFQSLRKRFHNFLEEIIREMQRVAREKNKI